MKLATLLLAAILAAPSIHAESFADVSRARLLTSEALAARKSGDTAKYLERMQAAFEARPNMPGMMLRLAGAFNTNQQPDKALPLLEKLGAMGLAFNLAADPDFATLKDDARFLAVIAVMSASLQPLLKSTAAFELNEKDFLAEGIAHDAKTGTFFVASVHQRKIVKRLPSGEIKPFAHLPAGDVWSVLAIAIDARRRILLAATAAMDQSRGIAEQEIGRTALLKYDLDREKLVARYELPESATLPKTKRVFGDLLLADNGDVYISESVEGGIYRIAGNKLTTFIAPGTFVSPQGMAWVHNGNARGKGTQWLYAADYSLGLFRIDMKSRAVEWLPPPQDACLLGLDGMVRTGNRLIATQNGIYPQRVVQIDLDTAGQPMKLTKLEANHPHHNEPTLGVMVGNDFYYVANSQWEMFERDKSAPLDKLSAPVILKLPIGTR